MYTVCTNDRDVFKQYLNLSLNIEKLFYFGRNATSFLFLDKYTKVTLREAKGEQKR